MFSLPNFKPQFIGRYGSASVDRRLTGLVRVWLRLVGVLLMGWGLTTSAALAEDIVGVRSLSLGNVHSCGVDADFNAICWGGNSYGQLGQLNPSANSSRPVVVSNLPSYIYKVSAGYNHNCSLSYDSVVRCWGDNTYGELDATSGAYTIGEIASGYGFNCARTYSLQVVCWGLNDFGQLGDNTQVDHSGYVPVQGLEGGTTAIAAGISHNCAVTMAGGVKCWGRNTQGQLGDNGYSDRWTAVQVVGLTSGINKVTAGYSHSCALTSAGGVKCWGFNNRGQLGNNSSVDSLTPVDVAGMSSHIVAIASGGYHVCALTDAGGVKCWGDNQDGQSGNNSVISANKIPVSVTGLESDVTAIAAGYAHTCALITSGAVKCWGRNNAGQLGDGTTTTRLTPVSTLAVEKPANALVPILMLLLF